MDFIEQALKTRKVQDVLDDNELFVEFIKGQPDWLEMAPGIITELMEAYNNLWCDAVYEAAGEPCVACGKSCTKNGVTWVDDTGHCVDCAPPEDDDIDESFCDGCQEYRDAFCQHEDCDLCVNCCGATMGPFDLQPPQGYLLIVNDGDPDEVEYFFSMDFESLQRCLREWVWLECRYTAWPGGITQKIIDDHFKRTEQTYAIVEPVMV